jgi:DNA-binding response OmpR family regulator
VARLRTKLDPEDQIQPIGTISGEGYRWTLPIVPA